MVKAWNILQRKVTLLPHPEHYSKAQTIINISRQNAIYVPYFLKKIKLKQRLFLAAVDLNYNDPLMFATSTNVRPMTGIRQNPAEIFDKNDFSDELLPE